MLFRSGGGEEIIGLAAEGGLGKILAELGVPGFLAIIWLGICFAIYVWKTLGELPRGNEPRAQLTLGLAAFIAVNAVVFASAHQVFGDIFVLLMIGACLGFVVASRRFSGESSAPGPKNPGEPVRAHRRHDAPPAFR